MITMATPLSAVRTMWSLSFLSSLKAKFCALVKLGLRGGEDLRTLLISALSSSASCWLSLVQAASMAVMYYKLGGCLGVTTKLGPLARTDLWAGFTGLLERLMTNLGLGSSLEKPLGQPTGGGGGDDAILMGRLGCPVPGGMPTALPDWPSWITKLPCLGRTSGLGNAASFTGRKESSDLGGIVSFPRRKVSNSLGRTVAFTQRKVSSCWVRIASFAGRKVSNCWRRLRGNAWCLTLCLGRANGLGNTASITGRKESSGLGGITSFLGEDGE